MEQTNLYNARLSGANLSHANIQNSYFTYADLRKATLKGTNLYNSDLYQADLRGADLQFAYLKNVLMEKTIFNEETILPNGENWIPETDMTIFSNTAHINYWCPRYDNAPDSGYQYWKRNDWLKTLDPKDPDFEETFTTDQ